MRQGCGDSLSVINPQPPSPGAGIQDAAWLGQGSLSDAFSPHVAVSSTGFLLSATCVNTSTEGPVSAAPNFLSSEGDRAPFLLA